MEVEASRFVRMNCRNRPLIPFPLRFSKPSLSVIILKPRDKPRYTFTEICLWTIDGYLLQQFSIGHGGRHFAQLHAQLCTDRLASETALDCIDEAKQAHVVVIGDVFKVLKDHCQQPVSFGQHLCVRTSSMRRFRS